ncbi:hypothetical protein QTV49_004291 [Vibrio vulnificus]|nr:hypothetical protein [Vibrio vulnificus]
MDADIGRKKAKQGKTFSGIIEFGFSYMVHSVASFCFESSNFDDCEEFHTSSVVFAGHDEENDIHYIETISGSRYIINSLACFADRDNDTRDGSFSEVAKAFIDKLNLAASKSDFLKDKIWAEIG